MTDGYVDPYDLVAEAASVEDEPLDGLDFGRPQDEDTEIRRIASEVKPKFLLVERSLAALFPDGQRVKVSLDIAYETVMAAIRDADGSSQAEQLEAVFQLIRDDRTLRVLRSQSFIASQAFAAKFFDLWGRLAGVAMGESRSSANSS
jgi:hypothetical protein